LSLPASDNWAQTVRKSLWDNQCQQNKLAAAATVDSRLALDMLAVHIVVVHIADYMVALI